MEGYGWQRSIVASGDGRLKVLEKSWNKDRDARHQTICMVVFKILPCVESFHLYPIPDMPHDFLCPGEIEELHRNWAMNTSMDKGKLLTYLISEAENHRFSHDSYGIFLWTCSLKPQHPPAPRGFPARRWRGAAIGPREIGVSHPSRSISASGHRDINMTCPSWLPWESGWYMVYNGLYMVNIWFIYG